METKGSKGKERAIYALAIVALLAASIIIYAAVTRGGTGRPSSSSSSSSAQLSPAEQQVRAAIGVYDGDLATLNDKNISTLYAGNSVLVWSGSAINSTTQHGPLNWAGTYRGQQNISQLWNLVLGDLQPTRPVVITQDTHQATISKLSTKTISPSTVNATYTISMYDTTALFGVVRSTINVQQQWTNPTGGAWQISQDSWDITSQSVQYPVG